MATRSWDSVPVTTIDHPARAVIEQSLIENLVDQLTDLDRDLWTDNDLDRQEIRDRVGQAATVACALLDVVKPTP